MSNNHGGARPGAGAKNLEGADGPLHRLEFRASEELLTRLDRLRRKQSRAAVCRAALEAMLCNMEQEAHLAQSVRDEVELMECGE